MTATTKPRFALKLGRSYAALLILMVAISAWLAFDFVQERDRLTADAARLAVHKSQLLSRSFGDTFLAADYVLRDVLGRIDTRQDLLFPQPNVESTKRLTALLKEKVNTLSGVKTLVVLSPDCIFTATASGTLTGIQSKQRFCKDAKVHPGQGVHIQYMPADQSAGGEAVVLMSRTLGSADGRLLGGVMAVIDVAFAQRWISELDIERNDVMAIVDTDGTLLARNPELPVAMGQRTSTPDGQPHFNEIVGSVFFTMPSPIDGRMRINGLSKLHRFPFVAIVGLDRESILQSWTYRAWQFAIGFVVLSVLAVLALRAHLQALRQREAMRQLATTDALTGIANRRQLMDIGEREFARARRYGHPLSVLMVDIDKFKSINDGWGHPTGDRVIQELARLLMALARHQDVGGRLGGEEFAVILPVTDAGGAKVIAERLRVAVEKTDTVRVDDGAVVAFTVSIGVVALGTDEKTFDAMLQRADKALYQAKQNGRNRVVMAA